MFKKPPRNRNKLPTIEQMYKMFVQINIDCIMDDTGEEGYLFTETDVYADQITALFEDFKVTYKQATVIAEKLKAYAKEQNYVLPTRAQMKYEKLVGIITDKLKELKLHMQTKDYKQVIAKSDGTENLYGSYDAFVDDIKNIG